MGSAIGDPLVSMVMTSLARPFLLTSIHDVSPRFETEVDGLLALLEPYVGKRLAMLVVPNHWGDSPIIAGSPFAARLRGWAEHGIEIFLHGYFHRDDARHTIASDRLRARFMTASEGEFLGLSQSEAANRITEGRKLIEDVTGQPIDGFVAPAWLYGEGAMDALRNAAIPIAEDHFRVWSPASGRRLAQGPVITWASRSRPRLASSLIAAATLRHVPMPVLRVGVHPPDIRHHAIVRSVEHTLKAALRSRRAAAYKELN